MNLRNDTDAFIYYYLFDSNPYHNTLGPRFNRAIFNRFRINLQNQVNYI